MQLSLAIVNFYLFYDWHVHMQISPSDKTACDYRITNISNEMINYRYIYI